MQTLVRFISIVCNNHALQLFYGIEIDFSFQAELNFLTERKCSMALVCMKKLSESRYVPSTWGRN